MKLTRTRALLAAVPALALGAGAAAVAPTGAQTEPTRTYEAQLRSLNGSGAEGMAVVSVDGNQVTLEIESTGLTPGAPHAQHFHGITAGTFASCPPAEADTDGDGLVSTPEGVPFYGGIEASLTTEGDTTPASALAVDRMPVADDEGTVTYSRTFEVTDEVAENITQLHIVQHGIDLDGSGTYDGAPSPLEPSVPFEATIPAACGGIDLASVGDVEVDRLGGRTRYETATRISEAAFPDGADTVYLARSDVLVDSVTAGMLTGGPVLLVPSCDIVPAVVLEEVSRLAPDEVVALGGDAAVCDDVVAQVAGVL